MVYEVSFCHDGDYDHEVCIEADSFEAAEKSFYLLFPDDFITSIAETEMPPVCIAEVAA